MIKRLEPQLVPIPAAVPATREQLAAAPAAPLEQPKVKPPSRESVLEKLDFLWKESLDGLEGAKRPVTVTKAVGSERQIPGDLHSRARFLSVAAQIAKYEAELTHELDSGNVTIAQVILFPKITRPGRRAGPGNRRPAGEPD